MRKRELMIGKLILSLITAVVGGTVIPAVVTGQIPENFERENLVAWCIVPFDANKRTPEQRAKMLVDLGLKRCAYDWRQEHVTSFEDEIFQYKERGIEFTAFWDEHPKAYDLFESHDIHPQIWKTLSPNPNGETQDEKIAAAAEAMLPLAKRTDELGLSPGLYNHGGWGGEPQNLVAVCKDLRERGYKRVGIVYNFHHGHHHIHDFKESIELMKPYLLCLNLNGMVDLSDEKYANQAGKYKILTIGQGEHEHAMIQTVIESGYSGPIGIIGHDASRDVAEVLKENLEGLETILKK